MKTPKSANLLRQLRQHLVHSFLSLVYPPICLHCDCPLTTGYLLFCQSCVLEMELLPIEGNCSKCCERDACVTSYKDLIDCPCAFFSKLYASFFLDGPILSLYNKLRTFQGSYLCRAASSFMAIQYLSAKLPLPDIIIPIPQSLSDLFTTSYHFNYLLAKDLATIFNRPLLDTLVYRYLGGQLSLKKPMIRNQRVLLVGDLLSTESSIRHCGEILAQGYPKEIYGLTFGLAL